MLTKRNTPIAITIALIFFFLVLLVINPSSYLFVNLFLLVLVVALLKKIQPKIILLLFSPIVVFPIILLFSILFTGVLPRNAPSVLFIISVILYAYLFREVLTRWIKPALRVVFIYGAIALISTSLFASVVISECWDISRAEKGVTSEEIGFCQLFNQYQPARANQFLGFPIALQFSTFFPTTFIMGGMFIQYFLKRKNLPDVQQR